MKIYTYSEQIGILSPHRVRSNLLTVAGECNATLIHRINSKSPHCNQTVATQTFFDAVSLRR